MTEVEILERRERFLAWKERMARQKARALARKRAVITPEDGVAILAVYARRSAAKKGQRDA